LDSGEVLSESLEIVGRVDQLTGKRALTQPVVDGVGAWIDTHSATIYKLAIPRWAYSDFPEFRDLSARQYFIDKKQRVFGSFSPLVSVSGVLVDSANKALVDLERLLQRSTVSETTWSTTDVLLFPVLRSLSIVKGIVWPAGVLAWCERMSEACEVPLHTDIAL
jgi:glutaredoxin 2